MDSSEEIAKLDEQGVKLLSPSQVALIQDRNQVSFLDDHQVRSLPAEARLVQALVKRHFRFITDAQACLLAPPQIKQMDCREELSKLNKCAYQFFGIEPNQVPFLDSEIQVVRSIPTRAALIERLQKQHLRFATPAQVSLFTAVQIQQMDCRNEIALLGLREIAHLEPDQVQYLEGEAQVRALPAHLAPMLQKRHLRYATAEQVARFTLEQNRQMDCREEIALLGPREIAHLEPAQVQFLEGEAQVRALPAHFAPMLQKRHLRFATAVQVSRFTPEQIRQMDCRDEIALLGPREIAHLEPRQVQFLEGEAQVQALPATAPLVAMLQKRHLRHATPAQVAHFTPEQIRQMDCREEIALLGAREIAYLIPRQVQFLEGQAQVQALLPDAALVAMMQKRHLRFATPAQVSHFTSANIWQMDCREEIALLGPQEVANVKPVQVQFVEGQTQVSALPANSAWIWKLEKRHLRFVTPAQARLLTPMQIQLMDCYEEISKLERGQWRHLTAKGIAAFGPAEVKQMQKEERLLDKISAIPPEHLMHVTEKRAIARLSPRQLEAFGSQRFNHLRKFHPLWNRVTRSALADLSPQNVGNVAKTQLKEIKKPATLRAVTMRDLVYLTKQQLILRRQFRRIYVIGVLTLGVAACSIALIATILLPGVALVSKKAGNKYRATLQPHIRRVGHLFQSYLPAAAAA